ncbi:MAG TPA: DegT/DnrJ/EryC1/StrS family aminotransferase [Blastocatellia bacterium]|nr:DegT/DnrJ/EryC1/StrS family aminotransferase [Blastocatellia bacterium]
MPDEAITAAAETLRSGYVGQGPRVDEFETLLRAWFGNRNIVTLNSCTSALQLGLILAGVKTGDSVISTPMTCLATNCAIRAVGADIIWADVDPITGNIDPDDIPTKVQPNTKAVMVVHWGGNPVDLDAVNRIADYYKLKVIEDAAHALGSEYAGVKIGSHSSFVCFSLQAVKHITTVDGGLLICKDDDDYRRAKLLRWYGLDRDAPAGDMRLALDVPESGFKFHMNDIAATIGSAQLEFIDGILQRHRGNADFYKVALPEFPTATDHANGKSSSYWLYTIHVKNRDGFVISMRELGIEVSQVHRRNDLYSAFDRYRCPLRGVDSFSQTMVCIPVGWWLQGDDIRYIADCVKKCGQPATSSIDLG